MLEVSFFFFVTAFFISFGLGVYALPSKVARLAAIVATTTASLGNQVVKVAVEGVRHVKFLEVLPVSELTFKSLRAATQCTGGTTAVLPPA